MKNKVSPVTRSKNEARANYNRLSRWYDWIAASETKFRQMGVQALDVEPGERVLEIGFGTGSCLMDFAQRVGQDGFVCGIDLSDGMAAVAKKRLDEAGLDQPVSLILGDAIQPPFGVGCFDAIFMSFTLELFDNPEIPRVLHQCRDILSPNGRLGIVSLVITEQPNFAERTYEWVHAKMPVTVDCRPIKAQAALREGGFKITEVISKKMWGLPIQIIVGNK